MCKKYIGYHLRKWFSNKKENCSFSITINLEIELYKLPLYKESCPELVPNKGSALLLSDKYLRKCLHKVTLFLKPLKKPFGSQITKLPRNKKSLGSEVFHIISLLLAF